MVKVIIIGGGASGMTAAIAAARKGAEVTMLEKGSRVGKKILTTGNGRCNITNMNIATERYHGKNNKFVDELFLSFGLNETISFFEEMGIYTRVLEDNKVFPASFQASSVLDVLRYEMEKLKVNVICEAEVVNIKYNKGFYIYTRDNSVYKGDRVIVATGGKASPELGSNGSGYKIAESFGHSIIKPFPALVQLKLICPYLKQLSGVKFIGDAEVLSNGVSKRKETGEILFTDYGISGPPILQLSRVASECLNSGNNVFIKLDIVNYLSWSELFELINTRILNDELKSISFSFVGLLNKRLIGPVLKEAGIDDLNIEAGKLSIAERKKIASTIKGFEFEISGTNSWSFAQVTAGGVATDEINEKTMESKKIKGLYFAGEIIDIDGDCGGYNLQFAWSSGFKAGENSAL